MFGALTLDLAGMADAQNYMVAVQQPRLVQVLAERAEKQGADIRWGHRLSGFDQHEDGVTVLVDGPDGAYELTAKYLLGADGGTSQTRKLAGFDFPGMTAHDAVARMAFGVVPPDDWVDPVAGALDIPGWGRVPPMPFYRAEHGIFACRRLGGRAMLITLELDRSAREEQLDDYDGDEPPVSLAEIEASVKRVLGADVPLRPISPDTQLDLRRFYGINSRIASRYRSGRVFLVGDAAHVHSPLGGPGLNLGLQDAVNLGWKLAAVVAGGADPALLESYEAERRPAAERVIMHTRAQLALIRPGTEVSALRELFAELLEVPGVVRRVSDLVSGNENRYRVDADAHPLTGHWVPDFAVAGADGPRRIAELARDGRPLLIDLTDGAVVAAATADIADRITVATGRPVGDMSAEALLVRPDGYVAWASSAPTPAVDELGRVAKQWFGVASS
jgi:2-polyprenyl-6-methoxyphenol hydroxylase-like FAD-dependent oxidoreductase